MRTNNRTPLDVLPTGEVVFAQRDYTDRYRVFSDLYVATIEGSVRRVTEGARLTAPSAGPPPKNSGRVRFARDIVSGGRIAARRP